MTAWWGDRLDPHEGETVRLVGRVVDHALGEWVSDQVAYGDHDLHHVKAKLLHAVRILDDQALVANPVRNVHRPRP